MKTLHDSFQLRSKTIQNRICIPSMHQPRNADDGGFVTPYAVEHYRAFAAGGAGLIMQEATCVAPDAKLAKTQIGAWCDGHIAGLKQIADAVHAEGSVIVAQIHHAGVKAYGNHLVSASDFEDEIKGVHAKAREMTLAEIAEVIEQFSEAAKRVSAAGYDGVEIHGCHGYLLSQFMDSRINHRTDRYANGVLLAKEILERLRSELPADFLVGIRLAAYEPLFRDGLDHATALSTTACDFMDISAGYYGSEDVRPAGYPFNELIYGAAEIKKRVSCPVFAVSGITTAELASAVLKETNVDMVDVGKASLKNPNWAREALETV